MRGKFALTVVLGELFNPISKKSSFVIMHEICMVLSNNTIFKI